MSWIQIQYSQPATWLRCPWQTTSGSHQSFLLMNKNFQWKTPVCKTWTVSPWTLIKMAFHLPLHKMCGLENGPLLHGACRVMTVILKTTHLLKNSTAEGILVNSSREQFMDASDESMDPHHINDIPQTKYYPTIPSQLIEIKSLHTWEMNHSITSSDWNPDWFLLIID